jgi:hypothetical protein
MAISEQDRKTIEAESGSVYDLCDVLYVMAESHPEDRKAWRLIIDQIVGHNSHVYDIVTQESSRG